ncbi:phage related protein [Bartonella tribocorum]|nr:phage related protein [Bartonella tribocorum]
MGGSCEVYGSVYGNAKILHCATIWGRAYGNATINTKSKAKLVPKNCEVYQSDNVVKIIDKTE